MARRLVLWVDRGDGKTNEKMVWSRRDTPCCEKVFASCVWTEAVQWNVGMKFWNERTMKKGWVGAAQARKVETKVMVKMRAGAAIRRLGTGAEARQKDKLE